MECKANGDRIRRSDGSFIIDRDSGKNRDAVGGPLFGLADRLVGAVCRYADEVTAIIESYLFDCSILIARRGAYVN